MAGCAPKKYAKGGKVMKFAAGGAVMAPAGMAGSGRLPVAGPPPNAPPMTPNIARMPPPDQTMPMPTTPNIARRPPPDQTRPIVRPGPGVGPRPPAPPKRSMGGPGPRGFKDGGLVSKVKPPGGRGTKSCKIC
jgi:hypothetical protein